MKAVWKNLGSSYVLSKVLIEKSLCWKKLFWAAVAIWLGF